MPLKRKLLSFFSYPFDMLVRRLPTSFLTSLIVRTATLHTSYLPPKEGIRFLMILDNHLYKLHGNEAVRYGGGIHTKHRHMNYHEFFVKRIGRNETVLDIGCGHGALAFSIASKTGARVVGIDMSKKNIEKARKEHGHPNIRYIHGKAPEDLPQGLFDVIVLSNVLEHIVERTVFLRQISESTNSTRFLIRVPLFERDWRVPLKKEMGVEHMLDATHCTEYTEEEFMEEMNASGFNVLHKEFRWGELWAEAKGHVD